MPRCPCGMLSKAERSRHSVWLLSRGCGASAASTPVVVCAGIRTTVCTPACAGTLDPVCFPPPFVFPHLLGENRRFEASLPSTYSAPSATYLTTSLLTLLVFLPLLSILPPFVLDLFLLLSLLLSYHHSCPTLPSARILVLHLLLIPHPPVFHNVFAVRC